MANNHGDIALVSDWIMSSFLFFFLMRIMFSWITRGRLDYWALPTTLTNVSPRTRYCDGLTCGDTLKAHFIGQPSQRVHDLFIF